MKRMSHFQYHSLSEDVQLESNYTAHFFFELLWMKKLMSSVSNAKLKMMKQRRDFFLHHTLLLEGLNPEVNFKNHSYLKRHESKHAFTRRVKKTKA